MSESQFDLITLTKLLYIEFDMPTADRFRIVSGFHAMGFHFYVTGRPKQSSCNLVLPK